MQVFEETKKDVLVDIDVNCCDGLVIVKKGTK